MGMCIAPWKLCVRAIFTFLGISILFLRMAEASTYVVMIPLGNPIYDELETLDGLGWLDTYFGEIRPFSRVEAARLTREAERNLEVGGRSDPVASRMIGVLHEQLNEEIGWLADDSENKQPTMF